MTGNILKDTDLIIDLSERVDEIRKRIISVKSDINEIKRKIFSILEEKWLY